MSDLTLAAFTAIASTIFVAELTDKDAFLLIALSTKMRIRTVFLAGALAFSLTTAVIVALGSVLVTVVPVYWVRAGGGVIMIAFALWEARGLVGMHAVEAEESRIRKEGSGIRAFLAIVGALALLDLAGDATEVLTIVFVARFSNALLVFAGALTGLLVATAAEAALGNRLGKLLTPRRLQIGSVVVFLALGISILLLNS